MDATELRRRISERLETAGLGPVEVARDLGRGRDYLSDFLKGKKESLSVGVLQRLAEILGVRFSYFVDAAVDDPTPVEEPPEEEVFVPIIGLVGADAEGVHIQSTGDMGQDMAPIPPGGSKRAVALEVRGDSMRHLAPDGALVYFERQNKPPTEDMIGYYVIAELEDGRVLYKRLLRGRKPGHYDLMSQDGPPIEDVRIVWAAEPTAIIPPRQARLIIRRAGERQVA